MRYVWGEGDVVLAEDQPIASARRAWFRERAEVRISGTEWVFRAGGRYPFGETQGQVRIRARRRGFWTSRYDVDTANASYSLGTRRIWSNRLVLTRDQSEIGEVHRSSWWANHPELTTTVDLPVEDAVFVLWLAYLIAARAQADAGGGGAAG